METAPVGMIIEPARRAVAADGDTALVAFCRREHPRLVGTIGYLVGDAELAQDLAQEALLRAVRQWDQVAALESPGGWVHRVAVNLALSALRKRSTRRRIDDRVASWVRSERPAGADIEATLSVRTAVAALPDRQRIAIVLRYFADLPVTEVAELMGCPPGTVKTLTSRAIAALKSHGLEATP